MEQRAMIRTATIDDVPAIRACVDAAYAIYIERIGHKPKPMLADYEAQVRDGIVSVAVDGQGEVQGYIIFYARLDTMMLENLAVSPRHQGKGVGKRLIAHCEDEARRLGCRAIELYTHTKMTENRALYARLGYEEIDRPDDRGLDRVFFAKRLG